MSRIPYHKESVLSQRFDIPPSLLESGAAEKRAFSITSMRSATVCLGRGAISPVLDGKGGSPFILVFGVSRKPLALDMAVERVGASGGSRGRLRLGRETEVRMALSALALAGLPAVGSRTRARFE